MVSLLNSELLEAYKLAKKLGLDEEFIKQIEEEIKRRGL